MMCNLFFVFHILPLVPFFMVSFICKNFIIIIFYCENLPPFKKSNIKSYYFFRFYITFLYFTIVLDVLFVLELLDTVNLYQKCRVFRILRFPSTIILILCYFMHIVYAIFSSTIFYLDTRW